MNQRGRDGSKSEVGHGRECSNAPIPVWKVDRGYSRCPEPRLWDLFKTGEGPWFFIPWAFGSGIGAACIIHGAEPAEFSMHSGISDVGRNSLGVLCLYMR